jgi:hypothetical protein
MKITTIEISGYTMWLVIDQLRTYTADKKIIETKDEYLCYFKLSEPTPFIYGELLRDTENKPLLFSSINEAIEKAKEILNNRI